MHKTMWKSALKYPLTKPFVFSILIDILIYLPIMLKLSLKVPQNLSYSFLLKEGFVALVVSVAISIPMSLDLGLDFVYFYMNPSYRFRSGWFPRLAYILSLLLPDLLIVVWGFPIHSSDLAVVLVNTRNCFFIFGIYGLLYNIDRYFHSTPTFLIYFFFTIALPFHSLAWFSKESILFDNLAISFDAIGCASLFYVSCGWWRTTFVNSIQNQSSSDMLGNIVLLLLCLYVFGLFIAPIFVDGNYISSHLPILTYLEAAFTVCLWLLHSRILQHEIYRKDGELEFKRMFVRYISHEVRTPLNTAIMGLQVLLEEMDSKGDHEGIDVVNDIRKSCNISVNILNELLTFDKLEAGTLILDREEVMALSLIRDTIQPFFVQAKHGQITLNFRIHPSACDVIESFTLDADKSKVAQVIRNLVSNALKFTPQGGHVEVLVSVVDVQVEGKMGQFLKLEVTDDGVGLSMENQQRLFKEVVQFNPGKLQKGGGSGLGLYISYGIAALHNGDLSVLSQGEGCGCTFTLTLPSVSCAKRLSTVKTKGSSKPSVQGYTTLSSMRDVFLVTILGRNIRKSSDERNKGEEYSPEKLEIPAVNLNDANNNSISNSNQQQVRELRPRSTLKYSNMNSFHQKLSSVYIKQDSTNSSVGHDITMRSVRNSEKHTPIQNVIEGSMKYFTNRFYNDSLSFDNMSHTNIFDDGHTLIFKQQSGRSSEPEFKINELISTRHFDVSKDDVQKKLSDPREEEGEMTYRELHHIPSLHNEIISRQNNNNNNNQHQQHQYQHHRIYGSSELNILVVDDSTISRKMQSRLLKKRCLSCYEAEHGLDAVEKIQKSLLNEVNAIPPIGLIIMDCNMPLMDGIEATKAIRGLGYKGIIIGVTGNVSEDAMQEFVGNGADFVLPKPLNIDTFDTVVMQLMAVRQLS